MPDTLTLVFILVPCLVIAIVFHEVAHGWVANMLGDPTAKEQRRLTLNPLRHVDPVGTLVVPGLLALAKGPIFGWAKPVPVMKDRLRNPRWGMVAVAAAGPGINMVMALAGAMTLGIVLRVLLANSGAAGNGEWLVPFARALDYFILINIFIALFNLLPIPPFDGSHIVEGVLPDRAADAYAKLRPFGMVLLIGLIALTWLAPQWSVMDRFVLPPVLMVQGWFLGIAHAIGGIA